MKLIPPLLLLFLGFACLFSGYRYLETGGYALFALVLLFYAETFLCFLVTAPFAIRKLFRARVK